MYSVLAPRESRVQVPSAASAGLQTSKAPLQSCSARRAPHSAGCRGGGRPPVSGPRPPPACPSAPALCPLCVSGSVAATVSARRKARLMASSENTKCQVVVLVSAQALRRHGRAALRACTTSASRSPSQLFWLWVAWPGSRRAACLRSLGGWDPLPSLQAVPS